MANSEFKFSDNSEFQQFYCGIDVHKHEISVCIYSCDESNSEFVKSNIFQVDTNGLEQFWNFVKKYKPLLFGMEATGIYHHVIVKYLKKQRSNVRWPFQIIVGNPADMSGMPGRQKNDKIDAELIAKYLARGLIRDGKPIIEILEDLKSLFRMGAQLEVQKTALKNRIKKILDRAGIRLRCLELNYEWCKDLVFHFCSYIGTFGEFLTGYDKPNHCLYVHAGLISKHMNEIMLYLNFSLSSSQMIMIRQYFVELEFITARKFLIAVEVDRIVSLNVGLRESVHRLATIPGISPYSSVWILSEIGSIEQFPNVTAFLSYCGVCPRTVSSAGKVYFAHTSRHSNEYLRTIFYNAAIISCNITKMPSDLKEYAKRTRFRTSNRASKLVYMIVAAKIARISYAILSQKSEFEPFKSSAKNKQSKANSNAIVNITDRKAIQRARNCLIRVSKIETIGNLGLHAQELADQLDIAINGKKN